MSGAARLSPAAVRQARRHLCEIGRRLWQRGLVEGNAGNISVRVGPNAVLCTPTLISKGFMKPADLCVVDLEGRQLAGRRRRTSEIFLHLEIMKRQPRARAVIHCHPPYATAFATDGRPLPRGILPESEILLGPIPIAPYALNGSPELGRVVARYVDHHPVVLMANHGVAAWSETIEDAWFRVEVVEACCRVLAILRESRLRARRLGPKHLRQMLEIKRRMGIVDPRFANP